jgi:phage tail sheath gpL-like
MPNVLYPKAKEGFLGGDIDLEVDNIVAVLVDTAAYSYNASHVFLSEIPIGDRIATSNNLSTKSILNGVFNSDDLVYPSVTGDVSEALVLVQDSGDAATSRLVAYIDTATGLPVTPNGTNINVTVNTSGWFSL